MTTTLVQSKSGVQSTAATGTTATWDSGATAGNKLYLVISSDATFSGPSGWTIMATSQINAIQFDVWTKTAAGGETSATYTNTAATMSSWVFAEFSNVGTLISASSQQGASSPPGYTTPSNTPSAGDTLLFAAFGGSFPSTQTPGTPYTWSNTFSAIADAQVQQGGGIWVAAAAAWREVTADGSTAYSTAASWGNTSNSSTTSYSAIGSYPVTGGGGGSSWTYGFDVVIG